MIILLSNHFSGKVLYGLCNKFVKTREDHGRGATQTRRLGTGVP